MTAAIVGKPAWPRVARSAIGYARAAMDRRWSLVVLWIALALLPLRGFANVVMHLPAQDAGTASTPCHGAMDPPAGAAAGTAMTGEAEGAGSADACAMCDLCHGASAVSSTSVRAAAFLPPRVAATDVLAAGQRSAPSLRPPRG